MSPETHSLTARVRRGMQTLLQSFGIVRQFPVLISLGIITLFAEFTYSGLNNVTLPVYIPTLGIDRAYEGRIIGVVLASFLLSETFLRIPFGWLSDRIGRARMVIGAMLLAVPSVLLAGLVTRYVWLIPLHWWDGMMAAALWPSVYALVGDTIPHRLRANAMGVINMMYMLGLLLGWTVASVIDKTVGQPRLFFFIGAALIGVGGLITAYYARRYPFLNQPHPEVHVEDAEHTVVSISRHTVLLSLTFLINFAITITGAFFYRYLTDEQHGLGFSLVQLAVIAGVPLIGVAIFALPLSRLGDVIGKVTAVRLAFAVIALCLWGFTLTRALPVLAVITLILGIAFSVGVPAWLAILTSLSVRKTRGVTLAGYGTVQGIAAVLGPLVAGQIWDHANSAFIFVSSAALMTLATVVSWIALPEHHYRPRPELAVDA
ncbi:MAG: MFS transporter [Armatimonadota bacterium]